MALVIIINNAIVKLGGVNIVCSPGKRVTVLFFDRRHKQRSPSSAAGPVDSQAVVAGLLS
jgi:hypothetical protein